MFTKSTFESRVTAAIAVLVLAALIATLAA